MLTGKNPCDHGIVANGWLFRDLSQIMLWRQSNALVQSDKIWDVIKKRDPKFTVANMFWWYNMYSTVDFSITPRPIYRSNGAKYPNVYSHPANLTQITQEKFGPFPLFSFWGPLTSIKATDCLTYLPHLDYNLQRIGANNPAIAKDVEELDVVIKNLLNCAEVNQYEVIILSEYGIQDVNQPIHINRALRTHGYIQPTIELGEEHPDPGASRAFAMADHQIAHVYIKNKTDIASVKKIISELPGVDKVLEQEEQKSLHLNHPRSGELIALAKKNAWFTYYYWLDDSKAPDFARTVDIHKKPGYDPVELFMVKNGKFKAAKSILKKKLGLRYILDIIPLDATLVKGSHGVPPELEKDGPLVILPISFSAKTKIPMTDIFHLINNYFTN
jgi:predicted AlkP superfamily pyrophosphatase or phosphodiesterase